MDLSFLLSCRISVGTLLEHCTFASSAIGRLIPKVIIRFCKSVAWLCGFVHGVVCERNDPCRVVNTRGVWCVARSQTRGEAYVMTGAHLMADLCTTLKVTETVTFLSRFHFCFLHCEISTLH